MDNCQKPILIKENKFKIHTTLLQLKLFFHVFIFPEILQKHKQEEQSQAKKIKRAVYGKKCDC